MRSLFVTDSVFVNSTSGSFGGVGAVGNYQGTPGDIIVARTVVTDARADIDGGAFFSENNLYVTDSTFERVSARRSGGAVFSYRQARFSRAHATYFAPFRPAHTLLTIESISSCTSGRTRARRRSNLSRWVVIHRREGCAPRRRGVRVGGTHGGFELHLQERISTGEL